MKKSELKELIKEVIQEADLSPEDLSDRLSDLVAIANKALDFAKHGHTRPAIKLVGHLETIVKDIRRNT